MAAFQHFLWRRWRALLIAQRSDGIAHGSHTCWRHPKEHSDTDGDAEHQPDQPHGHTYRQTVGRLEDKHGVAITIKAVALGDRLAVGTENPLATGQGHSQEQRRRTWEMEIGHQAVDDLK